MWKGLTNSAKAIAKKEGIPEIVWTHLDDAADSFCILSIWAHGLEGTIDYYYLYTNCVKGDVHA